jgi:very-long-chain (3R)-3-hydroxyacyl-CoA dehydratase
MMRVFDVDTFMTWIHYTMWFILYPLAFLCEGKKSNISKRANDPNAPILSPGTLMLVSIPLFEQSQRLSIDLPEFFDLKFSMPFVLRCFILILFFPSKLNPSLVVR